MINTRIVEFQEHRNDRIGALVAVEATREVPFEIKRAYYIYDVEPDQRRGFHSHSDLEQMLICTHGSVRILIKTPFEEEEVLLDSPAKGLYIGPMIWREMFDWQDGAVLMVLASKHFDPDDYIRDYADYEQKAKAYFKTKE